MFPAGHSLRPSSCKASPPPDAPEASKAECPQFGVNGPLLAFTPSNGNPRPQPVAHRRLHPSVSVPSWGVSSCGRLTRWRTCRGMEVAGPAWTDLPSGTQVGTSPYLYALSCLCLPLLAALYEAGRIPLSSCWRLSASWSIGAAWLFGHRTMSFSCRLLTPRPRRQNASLSSSSPCELEVRPHRHPSRLEAARTRSARPILPRLPPRRNPPSLHRAGAGAQNAIGAGCSAGCAATALASSGAILLRRRPPPDARGRAVTSPE